MPLVFPVVDFLCLNLQCFGLDQSRVIGVIKVTTRLIADIFVTYSFFLCTSNREGEGEEKRKSLTAKAQKGLITMFQSLNRKQQDFRNPVVDGLTVKLRMPACYLGKAAPTSIVVMELFWQQYGLDILHPAVNRWLEQNAPDVKSAAAKSQFVGGDTNSQIKVSPQGTIELRLPLKIDDRLREVSSLYILSQIHHSIEPETDLPMAA